MVRFGIFCCQQDFLLRFHDNSKTNVCQCPFAENFHLLIPLLNRIDSIPASEKAGTLYLRIYPYVDPDKITTMFLFATSPLLSQSGNTKSSIKGNTLKEPLNKTPTADDGSFLPILRSEKWEICRSRWRQRSHTDAGMPFAGTQSIPPFSKPCLDEKSLAVHSR